MKNRLLRIFFDVDFRCQHTGLKRHMMKRGLNVNDLEPDDMVIFINTAKNKVRALKMTPEPNSWGVLGYYRSPGNSKIDYRALKYIPQVFGAAGNIDMDNATLKVLEKELPLLARPEGIRD